MATATSKSVSGFGPAVPTTKQTHIDQPPPLVQGSTEELLLPNDDVAQLYDVNGATTTSTTDFATRLTELDGVKLVWEARPTCYVSGHPQGGPIWNRLRKGSMNASMLAYCLGLVPESMQVAPQECALRMCGLSEQSYDATKALNMGIGVTGEPIVREWDAKQLKEPIHEVGVSVWKEDPAFRASMDGDIDANRFVEYKIPKRMYRQLIEYLEAYLKGYKLPKGYKHIFDAHYIQMTMTGVVNGKKYGKYTVVSATTHEVFQQWIPIDYDYWYKTLYPQGKAFYHKYVVPVMRQHKLKRIDP